MVTLVARGLSFAHPRGPQLFTRVSFTLDAGWHGLVGPNGGGKSTLLGLLGGALVPDEGNVQTRPAGAVVVSCPQDVHPLDGAVVELGGATTPLAGRLRGVLRLREGDLARWPTLSPGERKRWQLGAALAREPDVLLLDEPTNHLDAEGRGRVMEALEVFRGVGVVVSHDRALLDALTHTTLRLVGGAVELRPHAYSSAREDWLREEEGRRRDRERLRELVHLADARLADARRTHAAADRSRSTATRMKGPRDHDARGALAKGKAAMGEARAGRLVGVRRAEAERARDDLSRAPVGPVDLGRDVFVGWEAAPKPEVLRLATDTLRAGSRIVLHDVRLTVGRRDRIRIAGPNGAGKTTLLAALLESHRGPADTVLHVPQELGPGAGSALVERVAGLPRDTRGRTASLLAALGGDPDRVLGSRAPSPGETRKLAFAFALAARPWLLALDEPTNHLDLPTVERLEAAVGAYPGALLLVTHDDAFAEACRVETWRIADGRVELNGSG